MKCPKCGGDAPDFHTKDDQVVNFCRGCGGTWFDKNELANALASDQDRFNKSPEALDGVATEMSCTACAKSKLYEVKYHKEYDLLVDWCPSCGGIFLDAKETGKAEHIAASTEAGHVRLMRALSRIKEAGYVPLSISRQKK
jgi:Zn-finger nucleic acid-binding protein